MKFYSTILFAAAFMVLSCNNDSSNKNDKKDAVSQVSGQSTEPATFFPVTDYIRGQLADIRNSGINPVKISSSKDGTDSSWIKMEDLDRELGLFLTPVIDSSHMAPLFSESKFLDQTINAFTLTYDPLNQLPDTVNLRHWDVYIDPETNQVKRVFMLKELPGNKKLQLTWLHGKSCKSVIISTDGNGKSQVEKEVEIKWGF